MHGTKGKMSKAKSNPSSYLYLSSLPSSLAEQKKKKIAKSHLLQRIRHPRLHYLNNIGTIYKFKNKPKIMTVDKCTSFIVNNLGFLQLSLHVYKQTFDSNLISSKYGRSPWDIQSNFVYPSIVRLFAKQRDFKKHLDKVKPPTFLHITNEFKSATPTKIDSHSWRVKNITCVCVLSKGDTRQKKI